MLHFKKILLYGAICNSYVNATQMFAAGNLLHDLFFKPFLFLAQNSLFFFLYPNIYNLRTSENASNLKKLKLYLVNLHSQKLSQTTCAITYKQIRDTSNRPCKFAQATAITRGETNKQQNGKKRKEKKTNKTKNKKLTHHVGGESGCGGCSVRSVRQMRAVGGWGAAERRGSGVGCECRAWRRSTELFGARARDHARAVRWARVERQRGGRLIQVALRVRHGQAPENELLYRYTL